MKSALYFIIFAVFSTLTIQAQVCEWKNFPQQINSTSEIKTELDIKYQKLNKFLDDNNLAGMIFTQVRNVNWITAGTTNTQIVLNKDNGGASLLIMRDGKKYLICNASESGRLMDQGVKNLGYELKLYNWYEANPVKDTRGDIIKEISAGKIIGSDAAYPGTVDFTDRFKPLRYSFTEPELKRYRWLAKECTEAVAEVCRLIKPGMNEFEIEAMTSASLRSRGIFPTVLLIGVDDRIYKYRHCLPAGAVLKNYAMVNIVAEKWGMPIAVTRFVHFGPLPEELNSKLLKTAVVNAKYEEATRPGRNVSEIWDACKQWYREAGYEGEWQKHHQGGSIGYDDREYVIYPGVDYVIQNNQPFAWNPTITGAKIEDTILAGENGSEVLSVSDWPMINVELNGKIYPQPSILLRGTDGSKLNQENINLKTDQK